MKRNRKKTIEEFCIDKIQSGINSLNNGNRKSEDIASDLNTMFNKLEQLNEPMFEDLWSKYCIARLTNERHNSLVLGGSVPIDVS